MVLLADNDYFMSLAILSAMRSKDPVTQVGACIVKEDGQVISVGYNGMPKGCDDNYMPWDKRSADRLETKHPYVCHAEMNAIVNAGNEELNGCSIYVTLFPCNMCAKSILKSGIRRIIYIADKPAKMEMKASRRMFELCHVVCERFIPSKRKVVISFADQPKMLIEAFNELETAG